LESHLAKLEDQDFQRVRVSKHCGVLQLLLVERAN
jgi:hypothetical protein